MSTVCTPFMAQVLDKKQLATMINSVLVLAALAVEAVVVCRPEWSKAQGMRLPDLYKDEA